MAVSQELLSILACPKCKNELRYDQETDGLICEQDQLVYPVQDDIPVMLVEEAVSLEAWEQGQRQTAKK